jgi:hypothetical protein
MPDGGPSNLLVAQAAGFFEGKRMRRRDEDEIDDIRMLGELKWG